MKFVNKKMKRKIFKNLFFKRFIIFITIFFAGLFTERFELDKKMYFFSTEFITIFSNRIFLYNNKIDKLIIDIKYKNYQKILDDRNDSIKNYRASEDLHSWVPAKINFDDNIYKAEIKLKGVHNDHWIHPKKWSFKIKILEEKNFNGMRRFSIQRPSTRDFLYEWLFMKTLKKEGLISHRNIFADLTINGDNLGIYYVEELYSKQLIEYNRRREGPIIGLDKNLWIKEANNIKKLGANFFEDSYFRAKVEPTQFSEDLIGTTQEIYLKQAISSFENFRDNKIKLNEAFDINQLAKLMAIKALFGASEFDWRDLKFYYNPVTSLLEPIGREVHISQNINDSLWWINDERLFENNNESYFFIKNLLDDKLFYKIFLEELNRVSQKNYLDEIINQDIEEFNKLLKYLKLSYPTETIFSKKYLESVRMLIQNTLNPIQDINVYLLNSYEDKIILSVDNIQSLPVEITDLIVDGISVKKKEKLYFIDGKKFNSHPKNLNLTFFCNIEINCKDIAESRVELKFNLLGQKKKMFKEVNKFYDLSLNLQKNFKNFDDLNKIKFINVDYKNKIISLKEKKTIIENPLIIPKDFMLYIHPGAEIIFSEDGQIISYSKIQMIGSDNNPIIVRSDFEKNNSKRNGFGILVINAKEKSIIKNVIFKNLSYPDINFGFGLMGSVNFYNTNVEIMNTEFIDNISGDDYLNIMNSKFYIKNTKFINSKADSVDFDFSEGNLEDIYIINSGNDGIDFSGSKASLKNIYMDGVGDKGLSVGEDSSIYVENLSINNSYIGVASKDLSFLEIKKLEIHDSKIIAAAYQKKIEFGPAKINIEKLIENNNETKFLSQKSSEIIIQKNFILHTDYDYSLF